MCLGSVNASARLTIQCKLFIINCFVKWGFSTQTLLGVFSDFVLRCHLTETHLTWQMNDQGMQCLSFCGLYHPCIPGFKQVNYFCVQSMLMMHFSPQLLLSFCCQLKRCWQRKNKTSPSPALPLVSRSPVSHGRKQLVACQ